MSDATANSPRAHQLVAPVWHVVSAPYRFAISAGSGSTEVGKSRHQTLPVQAVQIGSRREVDFREVFRGGPDGP
jgi:hypothetical protein